MADLKELKNAIRIGTVQSVSAGSMTARVKFNDKGGITSGNLHVIKRPVSITPDVGDISMWTPGINSMVLCIMMPDGDGDGFIIGEV